MNLQKRNQKSCVTLLFLFSCIQVLALLAPNVRGQESIFVDDFESGCPLSWSSSIGFDQPCSEVESSAGTLSIVPETPFFSPTIGTIVLEASGAQLSQDPGGVQVYINGTQLPSSAINLGAQEIQINYSFADGLNDIFVSAADSNGFSLSFTSEIWAGENTVTVQVVDEFGVTVPGAAVTASNVDNISYVLEGSSDVNGEVTFENLPGRTFIFSAAMDDGRFGTAALVATTGTLTVPLVDFDPTSNIANNDFSIGTDGWDVGTAPVTLIPHVEPSLEMIPSISPLTGDFDLQISTLGEGPQSVSRTFTVAPGERNVVVRYRFITSEVPGGYFGTEFNDYFSVSIRSQTQAGLKNEANSMNGLGLGAFDASGATAWREVQLAAVEGDVVQIDALVANVADGLYDSQLVLDKISEKALAITDLKLNDIDNTTLELLSSGSHTFFSGKTRIHGTITVEGDSSDALSALTLEVIQGGVVVATADLVASAGTQLLQSFGDDEKVEITTSQLLFSLVPDQINTSQNGTLRLRVRAQSANGQEVVEEYSKPVKILKAWTGTLRYDKRNEGEGGDSWVKPSVSDVVAALGSITIGDFSNMNGGRIAPHKSHRTGNDFDGWFSGYNKRDAVTAQAIINMLNAAPSKRIAVVYVTFSKSGAFWNAIKDVTLDDGRAATSVILSIGGHKGHFHMRIAD